MLLELTIRNFAIIQELDIEISDGLTVVTGETGAGKSIVLQALNLLLGSRAESDMIRHGEAQCEITANFSLAKLAHVREWLEQHELLSHDEPQQCLIRRIIRRDKPSRCFINDQSTTIATLKQLGLQLVDMHNQHEHQSLLRAPTQRQIIDQFAGHQADLKSMATLAAQIQQLDKQLNELQQNQSDQSERLALLSFQLDELNEIALAEGEFEELEQDFARLNNAQSLIVGIQAALDQLFHNDDSNITSELGKTIAELSELSKFDNHIGESNELLNSALSQIEETQQSLENALAAIEQDPEHLQEISQRLDTVINLARKHRCPENQLWSLHEKLQSDFDQLQQAQHQPERLAADLTAARQQYAKIASKVSQQRQRVAKQLSKQITEQMQELGMQGGQLNIAVTTAEDPQQAVFEHGIDEIEFQVSTNQGVPLKSLQKTASGGELSRISLAIQVITSTQSETPTLVFDEVDVGVGGNIASVVGNRLQELSQHAQIICITHQPQVASKAKQHLFVSKQQKAKQTVSSISALNDEQRAEEIARMLSGDEITERTKAHAQEMLQSSTK